jgi:CheY-like chemotaxis protein
MHLQRLQQPHNSATNGREAVEAYRKSPVDVVFMDLHMPVMNGLEASRKIRKYEHEQGLAPTAIVALTGAVSLNARQEAFASGMDLFLIKPVAMKVLNEILILLRDKGRGALRDFRGS